MPPERNREPDDDIVIEHPNREKGSSKLVRLIVFLLLVASAVLTLIITFGGWDASAGMQIVQIAYAIVYLILAFFVLRWSSGVLAVAAALAIIMLIFACVSAPEWFARSGFGYTDPALTADLLGTLTIIMIPLQGALIVFSMIGFRQSWNVEVERRPDEDDGRDRDDGRDDGREMGGGRAQPAPA